MRLRLSLLLSLALSLLASCSRDEGGKARKRPAPLVSVAPVGTRDVQMTVRAPVDLRPIARADVNSKVLGFLDAVLVDLGDQVTKGQLLATVRPSDLPDQLAAERASLEQLRANTRLAEANEARVRSLAPGGLVSQQDQEQTATELATARAQETASRARLEALAIRLGETRIVAPLDGTVSARRLDPGTLVGPGAAGPILSIVQVSSLRVSIPVREQDIRLVAVGQEAFVTLDAFPDRRFSGRVVRLAPALDLTTRTLEAEVMLGNPEGELRPGLYGRGAIVLETHPSAPVAPVGAVVINARGTYVFVVDGEVARRREVEIGVDGGDWLEITKGLAVGERIVISGTDGLADGAPIRVSEAKGASVSGSVGEK